MAASALHKLATQYTLVQVHGEAISIGSLASGLNTNTRTPPADRFWVLQAVRAENLLATFVNAELHVKDADGAYRANLLDYGTRQPVQVASPNQALAWQGRMILPASWTVGVSFTGSPSIGANPSIGWQFTALEVDAAVYSWRDDFTFIV